MKAQPAGARVESKVGQPDHRVVDALAGVLVSAWRRRQIVEPKLPWQPGNLLLLERRDGQARDRELFEGAERQRAQRERLERGVE